MNKTFKRYRKGRFIDTAYVKKPYYKRMVAEKIINHWRARAVLMTGMHTFSQIQATPTDGSPEQKAKKRLALAECLLNTMKSANQTIKDGEPAGGANPSL
jgi:hypothetical protein